MTSPIHLIERAAERLRGQAGLGGLSMPPGAAEPNGALRRSDDAVSGIGDAAAWPPPVARAPDYADPDGSGEMLVLPVPRTALAQGTGDDADGPIRGAAGADGTPLPAAAGGSGAAPSERVTVSRAALEAAGLVVGRKSRTRISEEFRIAVGQVLRTLQDSYGTGQQGANLLLITSSKPGEGKSFTSLNLAGCIAQQNQREVLLVDIDAKERPLSADLGLGSARGVLDLIADPTLRAEDLVVPTEIPSLSILPIGNRTAEEGALAASRPLSAVIVRLSRRFANRVVVLDSPPCLSTSDPSALAPVVAQILMVVEAERTQRNELEAAIELVRACPSITLLLNKIQLTTSYTFGAYHYFGTYS